MNEWPEDSGFGGAPEDPSQPSAGSSQPAAGSPQPAAVPPPPPPPPPSAVTSSGGPMDAAAQRMSHFDLPAAPSPTAPSPASPPAFGSNPGVQPTSAAYVEATTKKSKMPWIIGGVIFFGLVVIAALAIGVVVFARSGSDLLEPFSQTESDIFDSSSLTAEDTESIEVDPDFVGRFPGELSRNGFDSFLLELDAGDSLVVSVEAAGSDLDLDTVLVVIGPSGDQVAANDDAGFGSDLGGTFDSQVEFDAETSGTYTFEVLGFGATSEGSYWLTVERSG